MQKRLFEVSILRPLAIFLVVFYHSFAIYNGKWILPNGVASSLVYNWVADFSYSFMLPLFVLMSGYLFSFQLNEKKVTKSLAQLLKNKVQRLLMPCYIFGVIYILIVQRPESVNISHLFLVLIGGVGHLWFLPMLFWCFFASYLFHICIKMTSWSIIGVCLILYIIGLKSIPFSIGYACWYLIFFEIGYCLRCNMSIVQKKLKLYSFCSGILYILCFVVVNYLLDNYEQLFGISKYIHFLLYKIGTFSFGLFGCFFVYGISLLITQKCEKINFYMGSLDSMCFGVYLYHQFILKILYYDTNIIVINTPFLPWCCLFITIVGSLTLTYLTRLSKIGRYIIG